MINASALMFEESKKGFILDVRKIREKIGNRVCVFGNIDSISLLHSGTPEDIRKEVEMQLGGANNNFITCNGSPITPGTPLENIRAMMEAGREG
jgi:uroporphyrinogen decarboxylase